MANRVRSRKLTCYVNEVLYTLVHEGIVDGGTDYPSVAQYIEELILTDLRRRGMLTEETMAKLLGIPVGAVAA